MTVVGNNFQPFDTYVENAFKDIVIPDGIISVQRVLQTKLNTQRKIPTTILDDFTLDLLEESELIVFGGKIPYGGVILQQFSFDLSPVVKFVYDEDGGLVKVIGEQIGSARIAIHDDIGRLMDREITGTFQKLEYIVNPVLVDDQGNEIGSQLDLLVGQSKAIFFFCSFSQLTDVIFTPQGGQTKYTIITGFGNVHRAIITGTEVGSAGLSVTGLLNTLASLTINVSSV